MHTTFSLRPGDPPHMTLNNDTNPLGKLLDISEST